MNIVYNVCLFIGLVLLGVMVSVVDDNQRKAILIKYLKNSKLRKILQQEPSEKFYFRYKGTIAPRWGWDNEVLNIFISIADENPQLKKLSRRAKTNAIVYYFEVFKRRDATESKNI